MDIIIDPQLEKKLKKLKLKHPQILAKVLKQLSLFKKNSSHPSLKNHKLTGNLKDTWSIYIEKNLRAIYRLSESTSTKAIFFDIGTHDQVYRK